MMAADEGATVLETKDDGPKIPDEKKTKTCRRERKGHYMTDLNFIKQ